jgi:hypothetical protein
MRTVFGLEAIGNGSQLAPVRHWDSLTLGHEIEPAKIVTTRRQNAWGVLSTARMWEATPHEAPTEPELQS